MIRVVRGGVLLAVALTVAALCSISSQAAVGWWAFQTPSRNLRCEFTGHGDFFVRCGTLNDGFTYELGSGSQRALTNHRAVYGVASRYPDPPTLRYGMTWRNASWNLSCFSRSTGLTCQNRRHGFFLSRDRAYKW